VAPRGWSCLSDGPVYPWMVLFILKFADDKASNLPHAPIAEMITLVTADGVGLLTPQCVSMVELNAQIDFRIAELEGIREEASGKFAIDLRRHSAKA